MRVRVRVRVTVTVRGWVGDGEKKLPKRQEAKEARGQRGKRPKRQEAKETRGQRPKW